MALKRTKDEYHSEAGANDIVSPVIRPKVTAADIEAEKKRKQMMVIRALYKTPEQVKALEEKKRKEEEALRVKA